MLWLSIRNHQGHGNAQLPSGKCHYVTLIIPALFVSELVSVCESEREREKERVYN